MADPDAEDWQGLRDALCGEVPKADAERALERLRHARQDLPASSAEATPRLRFDETGEHVTISIEGVRGVVVRKGFTAQARERFLACGRDEGAVADPPRTLCRAGRFDVRESVAVRPA